MKFIFEKAYIIIDDLCVIDDVNIKFKYKF